MIPKDMEARRQAAKLYQSGATLREVGKVMGVSGERVRQLLRDAGVPTRSRGPRPIEEVPDDAA